MRNQFIINFEKEERLVFDLLSQTEWRFCLSLHTTLTQAKEMDEAVSNHEYAASAILFAAYKYTF